jgi:hypothetical protein
LMLAQVNWVKRKLLGSVLVEVRQTEQDAAEQSQAWRSIRDGRPLSMAARQARVQPYIDGLESCGDNQ